MTSTVYIAKNVYGGDGMGRLGDGRVVFVPGAWEGEQVKAEIFEEKPRFVRARLVEVVEPSPERVEPEAMVVPGMVYAGLSAAGEKAAKDRQLAEFFERARIPVPSSATVEGGLQLAYRNKAVYHFARQRGKWALGYRAEPGHEIVDVESDPLVVPAIGAALPEIRRGVMRLLTQGSEAVRKSVEHQGNVTVRWTRKSGVKWWVGDAPADLVLKETTLGTDFEVPADGFYQVNPAVSELLAQAVVDEYRRGANAAPELMDLYCGVGVFGILCRPPKLVGVESGRQAVAFAKRNAAIHKVQADFFADQVGSAVRRLKAGERTTVIVDPPRGGLEHGVVKWLAHSRALRIIYVSCDPATLIRDLKGLAGAYSVASVRRFEMFPRTARFETLVVLERHPSLTAASNQ